MSGKRNNCFDFLKEGHDKEFDTAMKSIDSMYDNLFNSDKLDKMFENLKYENNPITEPIDQMTQEIFNTNQQQPGPTYVKAEANTSHGEDDDFVVGEPLYQGQPQNYPKNPYANLNNQYSQATNSPSTSYSPKKPNNNFTNPYYEVPQAGQYFGEWSHKNNNTNLGKK